MSHPRATTIALSTFARTRPIPILSERDFSPEHKEAIRWIHRCHNPLSTIEKNKWIEFYKSLVGI